MSEPADKPKPTKSAKAPKAPKTAPPPPDLNGPDTFDLKALLDLMRALKPHAGAGIAKGADHLKNVLLKCDGSGRLRAVCKGLTGSFTMVVSVNPQIPTFQEFVEPERLGAVLASLKGDRVVVRFSERKVDLFSDGVDASLERSTEVENQRGSFAYDHHLNPDLGICVRASDLRSVLSRASRFTYKRDDKPFFAGVHLSISTRDDYRASKFIFDPIQIANGDPKTMLLRISASDGHRLFVEHVGIERVKDTGKAVTYLLDFLRKAFLYDSSMPQVMAWLNLLSDDAEVWIAGSTDDNGPVLSLYSEEYKSHLEIGSATAIDYPDWTRVLPVFKPDDTLVTAAQGEFIADVKRFNDLCRAHGDEVHVTSYLTIAEDRIEQRQSREKFGNNPYVFVRTPAKVKQVAPVIYGVNRAYWSEGISALQPDTTAPNDKITVRFAGLGWGKDPTEPVTMFRGEDVNACFNSPMIPFILIMPLKLGT